MNGISSYANADKAESGTNTSPLDQVVNEYLPARNPKARRLVSRSGKRTAIIFYLSSASVRSVSKLGDATLVSYVF